MLGFLSVCKREYENSPVFDFDAKYGAVALYGFDTELGICFLNIERC